MEEVGLAYGLVKFVHILLLVYWLGGDAGVFYSSTFVVNPSLTREARMTAAKIFIELDMLPRYCLALMLTVGGVLSQPPAQAPAAQQDDPDAGAPLPLPGIPSGIGDLLGQLFGGAAGQPVAQSARPAQRRSHRKSS